MPAAQIPIHAIKGRGAATRLAHRVDFHPEVTHLAR